MYTPQKFRIDDPAVIQSFIEEHPFGLLLSIAGELIHDTHTPFVYGKGGRLLGHIAKANPQWHGWSKENRVKVIFTGPHAYISPRYYQSEFAVPTWNYTAVSVSGRISIVDEESEVLEFLDQLIAESETTTEPWTLDRTDARYMNLLSGIVVFSVDVETIEASFKMNQNKSTEDQRKVINSLSATGCPFDHEVSEIMSRNIQQP